VDIDEQKFVEFFNDYVILTGIQLDINEPEQQKNNGRRNYI